MRGRAASRLFERQTALLLCAGLAVVTLAAFQAGRKSVSKAASPSGTQDVRRARALVSAAPHDNNQPERRAVTMRNIATVPFSQLYDVLRGASREQITAWGQDLERMPYAPSRTIALIAFYKSLIQVDAPAAVDLILQTKDVLVREVAIDSVSEGGAGIGLG